MKSSNSIRNFPAGLIAAMLLAIGANAWAADKPVTLKDAFKDYFPIGTAVNRGMVTDSAGFRRSAEQNAADVALLKEQFNQIVAENDMKWQLIHPREGKDGLRFRRGRRVREVWPQQQRADRRAHARLAQPDAELGVRGHQPSVVAIRNTEL